MKTVLITGANRGIGFEFSRQYAAEGWRVFACSRRPSQEIGKLAEKHPGLVENPLLDVSDRDRIEQLGRTLSGEPIDLLISNAGIYPDSGSRGFGHTDYGKWMEAFSVNTMATLKLAETFIEQVSRSTLKTIAVVTSKMGSISDNTGGSDYLYRSSKAAVNMVVKSLSIDLGPLGITAVLLHPGWVKTDMGGPGALISVEESVSGMKRVIAGLSIGDSGKFIGYDGKTVPW